MSEIRDFIDISRFAGERFDLVQAGGGNSSVKLDNGEMIIKASGFSLSDVNEKDGYSIVQTKQIADIIKIRRVVNAKSKRDRENITSDLVRKATIDTSNRPSIETLLHSFLLKYTLHTHPVSVNVIVSQKGWRNILKTIFKDEKIALVEYQTPGVELAIALSNSLEGFEYLPNIIFLQNHGLIITSNSKNEIFTITEEVLKKTEDYLKLDLSKYKFTTEISKALYRFRKRQTISYLSCDDFLNTELKKNKELFFQLPFCPDSLVYCGIGAVEINNLNKLDVLKVYKEKYYSTPNIIIYQNNLFIVSQNIKKAREIEDVLKFHIMILAQNNNDINFLPSTELAYLSNWEAEKYRQNI